MTLRSVVPVVLTSLVFATTAACSRSAATSGPSPAPHAAAPAAVPATPLQVDAPARTTLLAVGDPVPAFHGITADGHPLDVAAGPRPRALVVYFYPRDETPGCTIEAEAFRDEHAVYEAAGVDVVGISTDDNDAHRGFASNHQLPFSLLADPQGRIAAAFGVPVTNGFAQRTTFVVDRQGHIARVFSPVQVRGHADEVIAAVRAL